MRVRRATKGRNCPHRRRCGRSSAWCRSRSTDTGARQRAACAPFRARGSRSPGNAAAPRRSGGRAPACSSLRARRESQDCCWRHRRQQRSYQWRRRPPPTGCTARLRPRSAIRSASCCTLAPCTVRRIRHNPRSQCTQVRPYHCTHRLRCSGLPACWRCRRRTSCPPARGRWRSRRTRTSPCCTAWRRGNPCPACTTRRAPGSARW